MFLLFMLFATHTVRLLPFTSCDFHFNTTCLRVTHARTHTHVDSSISLLPLFTWGLHSIRNDSVQKHSSFYGICHVVLSSWEPAVCYRSSRFLVPIFFTFLVSRIFSIIAYTLLYYFFPPLAHSILPQSWLFLTTESFRVEHLIVILVWMSKSEREFSLVSHNAI